MTSSKPSAADKLRELINGPEVLTMPCCYDGLTARLVEDAGFPLTFMTGFGVSGTHGLPDTQARKTRLYCNYCNVFIMLCVLCCKDIGEILRAAEIHWLRRFELDESF